MLDDFMKPVRLVVRDAVPDGMGGMNITEHLSQPFPAGISQKTSDEVVVAGRVGASAIYNVTTRKNVALTVNDIIQAEDGIRYRINGIAAETPSVATEQYRCVTAEVFA